jgi:tRNA uridine 5-carbamoylmethylation protein Kti12
LNLLNLYNKPILLVVAGSPRSGKTTLSNALLEYIPNSIVITFDKIREDYSFKKGEFSPDSLHYSSAIGLHMAFHNILEYKSVILDGTFSCQGVRDDLDLLVKSLKDYKKQNFYYGIISLIAQPNEVRKRVMETYMHHSAKDVTPERGEKLAREYKPMSSSLIINTSEVTLEEEINLTINYLNSLIELPSYTFSSNFLRHQISKTY